MAITVKQIIAAQAPGAKATALVDMGNGDPNANPPVASTVVTIEFWPELVQQWGGDPTQAGTAMGDYIIACAQWSQGQYAAAVTMLQPHASGNNWAQQWITQHPDPGPYGTPNPY